MNKLHNSPTAAFSARRRESGLSLIEILVGLVIGLIGIIVMMQVYALSEGRKRTTTAGGDAQNSAFIALDTLQRSITQSGAGFAHTRLLNCTIQLPNGNPIPLAPVIINPPDTVIPPSTNPADARHIRLLVSYGGSNDQPDGYNLFDPTQSRGPSYTLTSTGSFNVGDWLIHAPATCQLVLRNVSSYAAGTTTVTVNGTASTDSAAALFNLGATPRFLAFAVRNGTLTVCDYMANNCGDATQATLDNQNIWRPMINNVAAFQAQYHRDTTAPMDGIADLDGYGQTTPSTPCLWARTSALRLVLATRSAQYEKENVTLVAPTWRSANIALDVSDDGTRADWQRYRYRVFETEIPLRNIAWMGVVAGC